MARDFDFRPKPTRPVSKPPAILADRRSSPPSKRSSGKRWLLLLVAGLAALSYGVYLQFSKPAPAGKTAADPTPTDETPVAAGRIQVYDGGAGETASKQLATKLTAAGYEAEYVGATLDSYDGVEIWHAAGYGQLAKTVAAQTGSAQANIRETQLSSGYAIQIFLGGT